MKESNKYHWHLLFTKNALPRTVEYCAPNCTLNIGGEFHKLYKEIHPKKLVLRLGHSGSHTTFLDLDIAISNDKISTKLHNKRDDFSIFISLRRNFHRSIHHLLFYWLMMSEISCIAKSSSSSASFCEKSSALITRMDTRWKWVRTCLKNFEGIWKSPISLSEVWYIK